MIEKWIKRLSETFGLENFLTRLDSSGWELQIDEETKVVITELDNQGYSFYTAVAKIKSSVDREDFLTKAMFANYFLLGTNGCVLALDGSGENLTVSKEQIYSKTYETFEADLESFLNIKDYWAQEAEK
jgi:hypothetical protein